MHGSAPSPWLPGIDQKDPRRPGHPADPLAVQHQPSSVGNGTCRKRVPAPNCSAIRKEASSRWPAHHSPAATPHPTTTRAGQAAAGQHRDGSAPRRRGQVREHDLSAADQCQLVAVRGRRRQMCGGGGGQQAAHGRRIRHDRGRSGTPLGRPAASSGETGLEIRLRAGARLRSASARACDRCPSAARRAREPSARPNGTLAAIVSAPAGSQSTTADMGRAHRA
jgi:hypothetical protein